VIFSPTGQLITSKGACLGYSTNNVVEYSIVVEILRDDIAHGIHSLEFHLDAQLLVSQLNDEFCIRGPMIHHHFLWIHFLECYFYYITYVHVPRNSNLLCDAFVNYVLDWYLYHSH
jgi:hypothetical protein